MILDELVLNNVGTFAGRNAIALAPPSPARPIVLVGGLNGVGKTTFLDAIHLALYGALAQPSGRRSGSYESYLTGLIHHGVPADQGASIELAFRAHQQGSEHQYRVRRVWRSTGAAVRECLDVEVDGKPDRTLTSTWNEHVETFLPRGIAGLFFFDGEQIEALADLESSRQVLGSALASLLGLDLVQRLVTDLSVIRRRHRVQQVPANLRQVVEERQHEVTAIRQAEEDAWAAAASVRGDVERGEKKLFELTEQYRSAGGELLDQHEVAESRRASLRSELTRTEDDLREELSGASPFLLAPVLLTGLNAQVRREAAAVRERVVVDVVTDRDQSILSRLRDAKVSANAVTAIESFLTTDREQRRVSAQVSEIADLKDPGPLEFLISGGLPAARERLRGLIERRDSIRADIESAERFLAAIPSPESLAPLRDQREAAAERLAQAQAALTRAEDQLASLQHERTRANAAYEGAVDRAAQANLTADDQRRLVDHIDRVSLTLEALRAAAARRHMERIGSLVHEALNQLLRKESLITKIEIDPVSHTVELAGQQGRHLSAKELSAGERQLLAVALLWGLARASGQPLPVVIDTPLGRLDGSHRMHLLDRYFPHASHQVILLSTDTEIDQDAYRRLRPHIGHAYRLEFDQTASATRVENGYFWE